MDVSCVLCNHPKPNYTPPPHTDDTCSACVQNLLKFTQDELKAGHALAIEKGYTAKADAIASFTIPPEVSAAGFKAKPKTKNRRKLKWQKRRIIK